MAGHQYWDPVRSALGKAHKYSGKAVSTASTEPDINESQCRGYWDPVRHAGVSSNDERTPTMPPEHTASDKTSELPKASASHASRNPVATAQYPEGSRVEEAPSSLMNVTIITSRDIDLARCYHTEYKGLSPLEARAMVNAWKTSAEIETSVANDFDRRCWIKDSTGSAPSRPIVLSKGQLKALKARLIRIQSHRG